MFFFFGQGGGEGENNFIKKEYFMYNNTKQTKNLQKYKDSINLGNGISSEKGEPS